MTEQILDVRGSLRLLRRFWKTVAVVLVIGLLAGAAYGAIRPPSYSAKALVLLPGATNAASEQSSAQAGNTITTDARIATSAAVLLPAGRKVDPSLSLATLQRRVSTSASSDATVLGISATGSSAARAEALANAVADELVSFVTSIGSVANSGTVSALQSEENQLSQQLASLQSEIATVNGRLAGESPTSKEGQDDTNLVAAYSSEQTNLQLQMNQLKSEVTDTELGQVSANQGTQVIERAVSASSSRTSTLVLWVLVGALVGAAAGSVLVLARHRADPKLFTRNQIARALGVPVVLSMQGQTKNSSSEWDSLLERYNPSPSEQWNVRKALREIGSLDGETPQLEILVLAGDSAAAALAAQVAIGAAVSKVATLFVFVDEHSSLPTLQTACLRLAGRGDPRTYLQVLPDLDLLADRSPELTVITRVLDGDTPDHFPANPGTVTVLAVSSGAATEDQLARIAIAATDSGHPLRAVMIANPSSEDQTTGRFPDETPRGDLVLHRRTLGGEMPRTRLASGRLSMAIALPFTLRSYNGNPG